MATANAPSFPLPLRNALAELVIDGLESDDAATALRWLAGLEPEPSADVARRLAAVHLVDEGGALLDVHRPHADAAHRHAVRGLRATATYRAAPAHDGASAV